MNEELPTSYDPKLVEDALFSFWEKRNLFAPSSDPKATPYCIVIPPPNVTGSLHMGHALMGTLQDVLIRWRRMCGDRALWVPGTDHAGIATQAVVERHLFATLGKKRGQFSREEFVKHVWEWKEKSEGVMLGQIKKLGCSCDFSRLAFTMDEKRSLAVRTLFKKLFDDGLIYRGDYLVNWDPVTETALADDEVEHEERASFLYHIRYPLEGGGFVTIATTRPETMLGDVAIAFSPKDERYAPLAGRRALLPFLNRELPLIADPFVDPTFGSGLVKITPAHDHNDYAMALRQGLPFINIMTPDGKINENGGGFAGLPMEEARVKIVEALKAKGLLEKVEPHTHRIGLSYRSKAVIEPYLSKQWFVKLSAFKTMLKEAVTQKEVRLIPDSFENTYFHWIDNLRDWCISRQLWWGHRIPIWYHKDDPEKMACFAEGGPSDPENWRQDEDVLDTWFSSALWPFSVLGWPEKSEDLATYYPTSTLVTGHDILFFWVARMLCMGKYALGSFPFKEVFLHGLIYGKSYWRLKGEGQIAYLTKEEREPFEQGAPLPPEIFSKWEKMSKSKGNIIDPLEIIDKYGADAMRFALISSATHARQIDLDVRRFEECKHFANKIWNGARFVLMNLKEMAAATAFKLEDKWILSQLRRTVESVQEGLETYAFDKVAHISYAFFWKEFCSSYVELCKPALFGKTTPEDKGTKQLVLLVVLDTLIRLMHPLAPFITEEIFQIVKRSVVMPQEEIPLLRETKEALAREACIASPYPQVRDEIPLDEKSEAEFAFMEEVLRVIRNLRAEMNLPPSLATHLAFSGPPEMLSRVKDHEHIVRALVKVSGIEYGAAKENHAKSASGAISSLQIFIPIPQEQLEKERERLTKERVKLEGQRDSLQGKLANKEFTEKAPKEIVEKMEKSLKELENQLGSIAQKLQNE